MKLPTKVIEKLVPKKEEGPPPLLVFVRVNGGGVTLVEATARSIRAAEDQGWVVSEQSAARRRDILDSERR